MKDLAKDAASRLAECRRQKSTFDLDIREGYFFAAPHRARQISSSSAATLTKPTDESELQISIGMEESETFTTTLIESFMPEGRPWAAQRASTRVAEIDRDEVEEMIAAQTRTVFDLVGESNFYSELATTLNPDGAVGTFALWIARGRFHEPVAVRGVPLRELEINVGPDGAIDDRFVIRHTKNRFIRHLVGNDLKLTAKIETQIKDKPDAPAELRWGFWRLWDRNEVTWQSVVMIGAEVVEAVELIGWGSCPLIPVTFNRHTEFAFGCGPLIKALPELRILDDMAAGEVENVDMSLRPPMAYPDDSFSNIEHGVETGAFYPVRPGTANDIKKMYEPNRLDAVYFEQQLREQRVRRLFYNDFPQQRGDTPPTATQWVDEMAMAQRKIGTPGLAFWKEGPAEIFQRFRFLAAEAGLIQPIAINGREISLVPDNPTRRAKDQQKVAIVVRTGQIAATMFPEEFKAKVDGGATLDKIFELMDVRDVFVPRPPEQIQQAVDMLGQLAGAGGNAGQAPQIQTGAIGGPVEG